MKETFAIKLQVLSPNLTVEQQLCIAAQPVIVLAAEELAAIDCFTTWTASAWKSNDLSLSVRKVNQGEGK